MQASWDLRAALIIDKRPVKNRAAIPESNVDSHGLSRYLSTFHSPLSTFHNHALPSLACP